MRPHSPILPQSTSGDRGNLAGPVSQPASGNASGCDFGEGPSIACKAPFAFSGKTPLMHPRRPHFGRGHACHHGTRAGLQSAANEVRADPSGKTETMTTFPGYHVLAKPTGPICNLDCEYCFFLSKEMLYPGDRFRMADELLETYLRQLLESHLTPDVTVAWQGGEPTMMGLDFFRRSVELVDELKQPHQRIQYTIQTNGVLVDEHWAEFFKTNDVLVGLSADGPKDLHDRYRVDKRPLYVLEGDQVTDRTVNPEAFGRFLATLFDEWAARCRRGVRAALRHRPRQLVRRAGRRVRVLRDVWWGCGARAQR